MADQTATTISVMGIIGFISELREAAGKSVLEVSIYEKTWNGTEEVSESISISLWGKDAEMWHPLLQKGMKAAARGTVKVETFIRKSGEQGSKRKVSAREFIAFDMKALLSGQTQAPTKPAADEFDEYMQSDGRNKAAPPVSSTDWIGDVPF